MSEEKTFYNVNGERRTFKVNHRIIGSGHCGFVTQYKKDKLLKEYFPDCRSLCKLKLNIYKIIQSVANRHVMKIYEFLYKEKDELGDTELGLNKVADAYTCQQLRQSKIDILFAPSEYILENLHELILLAIKFAKKQVELNDLKWENTILMENNMVLIDPDLWKVSWLTYEDLKESNVIIMLDMFEDLCCKAIESDFTYSYVEQLEPYYDVVRKLFDISKAKNYDDVTQIINQRLKGYKYPIDYIKKDIKRKYYSKINRC